MINLLLGEIGNEARAAMFVFGKHGLYPGVSIRKGWKGGRLVLLSTFRWVRAFSMRNPGISAHLVSRIPEKKNCTKIPSAHRVSGYFLVDFGASSEPNHREEGVC